MHTYGLEIYCSSVTLQGQLHLPTPFFQAPTHKSPGSTLLPPLPPLQARTPSMSYPPAANVSMLPTIMTCFFLGLHN